MTIKSAYKWWEYQELPELKEDGWLNDTQPINNFDKLDFHIDLGGGTVPKAKLNIDSRGVPDILMDLDNGMEILEVRGHKAYQWDEEFQDYIGPIGYDLWEPEGNYWSDRYWSQGHLPFPDNSVGNIISHHCLEHIGDGFIHLMDEVHRIMVRGSIFRIISPLFPSLAAVSDTTHKRVFCTDSFEAFCGTAEGDCWMESFSEPYTRCRFEMVDKWYTPAEEISIPNRVYMTIDDIMPHSREIRVALKKQ